MIPSNLWVGQPRYLCCSRVLSRIIFWFFWDKFVNCFLSFPLVWLCQLPIVSVSFSPTVLLITWFDSLIPSVMCRLSLFITSRASISSLYLDWIFSQSVLGLLILFRLLAKKFDVVHVHQVVDFSCDLLSL